MKTLLCVVCMVLAASVAIAGGIPQGTTLNETSSNASAIAAAQAAASIAFWSTIYNHNANTATASTGPVTQTTGATTQGVTANPSFEINAPAYPIPWATNTPPMQTPNMPKTWQLAISQFDDGAKFAYADIPKSAPAGVEIHGKLIGKRGTGNADFVTVVKSKPKGKRLGTYVIVAAKASVDATVLEDAALFQATQDYANTLYVVSEGFHAKNNIDSKAGGAGVAFSILSSIFSNMANIGPYIGGQMGNFMSNQDAYIWKAIDTYEVE